MKKIIYLSCFLLFTVHHSALAQQETCATNLKRAEKLFDEGKLDEMHSALADCMHSGFNKEQTIRAYELIIQAYLADENSAEAERRMVKLLKKDPTFSVEKKVLSAEFINLFEQLQAAPIFSIGIVAGPSIARFMVSEQYGVHDLEQYKGKYTSKTGFSAGLLTQFYISHKLLFDAEFSFVQNKYQYSLEGAIPQVNTGYIETQNRIDVPLSLKYQYSRGSTSPFIQLGIAPGYVAQNTLTAERTYTDSLRLPVTGAAIDIKEKRNNLSLQAFAGIGCSYRIKRNSIFASVRYSAGMLPYVASSAHRGNDAFTYRYFIIDDEFKMHNIACIVGYSFSFYKLNKKIESL